MYGLAVLVICGLVLLILASIEIGYRIGCRRRQRLSEKAQDLYSTIEGSMLALLGLLIAFTFSGAGARFDARRALIGQEANTIGTAYLRIDLVPSAAQTQLREDFRKYTRSRIEAFRKIPDVKAVDKELAQAEDLQRRIWMQAVEATRQSGPAVQSLVLSSLNEMIDITTIRTVAARSHPPLAVFVMLALTLCASSALMGYSSAMADVRQWVYTITYALVLSAAVYVILDYEFPRIGFIHVGSMDQVLVDTLAKMQ
jgi:hypothetical protein